jgi:hypothetical protein
VPSVEQAFGVDDHLDAGGLEHGVARCDFVGVVDDIGEAGEAGLLDAEAQAHAAPATRQKGADSAADGRKRS